MEEQIQLVLSSKGAPKISYQGRTYSRRGPLVAGDNANRKKYYLKCDFCGLGTINCVLETDPEATEDNPYSNARWVPDTYVAAQPHRADCVPDVNPCSIPNMQCRMQHECNMAINKAKICDAIRTPGSIYSETLEMLQGTFGVDNTARFFPTKQNFLQSCRRAKRKMYPPMQEHLGD